MSARHWSFTSPSLCERVETRLQFAGNLAVTGVAYVDSSDHALSALNPGQQMYIQVNYQATNLPAGATYRFDITLNGMTISTNYTSSGANGSGTSNLGYYWGTFPISPGTNQVTATVDPDHTVAETSFTDNTYSTSFNSTAEVIGNYSYSVEQIRNAYGLNNLAKFGTAAADGTGQTIAIVDAYNDPNILNDLDGFDTHMHMTSNTSSTLYDLYGGSNSFVNVYSQTGLNITSNIANSGSGGVPIVDPAGGWAGEETLDVEWAHAIAPGAKIDIVETDGTSQYLGLFTGAGAAGKLPNVTVVSMSWTWAESNWASTSGSGETSLDPALFVTQPNHSGVTYLASTGDGGAPAGYPSVSPNVVAVGGTAATISSNAYGSETGWGFLPPSHYLVYNPGSGFSQTGTWTTQSGGLTGIQGYAVLGSNSTTTWTGAVNAADVGWLKGTEVSATWQPSSANATNAVYKIYDGTSSAGTLLGTVNVNQTYSPAGPIQGGKAFQELGVFYPTSGHLAVVLTTVGSNGNVSADAVGFQASYASGGGQSVYEREPLYQESVQLTNFRTTPDVSFDASQNTGVTCFQNNISYDYFGTSLAAPCWAGIMAIVDQGRVAAGGSPLDNSSNPTQAVQALYALPSADFHDITTGYNGFTAGAGYDQVTGRGSPFADKVIPDLVNFQLLPAVVSSTYNYDLEPPTLTLTFNEDVSASLTASDLVLTNTTTGQTIPSSAYTVSFAATGSYLNPYPYLATFTFTGYTNDVLPDGKYTATIAAANVTDPTGHAMSSASTTNFFTLSGDINHDGKVDIADLGILATHYGSSYVLFSTQGDVNYDHKVDIADLGILATNYGKSLPAVYENAVTSGNQFQTQAIKPMSFSYASPTPADRKKRVDDPSFLAELLV